MFMNVRLNILSAVTLLITAVTAQAATIEIDLVGFRSSPPPAETDYVFGLLHVLWVAKVFFPTAA